MSERRQSRCVVIAYDEDAQAIEICTLLKDSLASRMERALRVPFPLEEMDFDLNDEQARIEYRNARATLDRVYPWAKPISPKPIAVVRVGPDIALYIEFESVEIDPPSRY
ncbi:MULTISPECIES: hypothetical protein [unclassified Burkholderia]|uniref:hypothetical protein n=1 Tax=unclassified Burkholderia TaxID=2613784 RepID=UPI0014245520|nr:MULTISPECIES: hypothetical protein [unclassified Burkholderia]NIE87272.1 hypothetical protein [Burkholderia sp. Tr-860]NIF65908.1 hypothetical protein [Burkholderia sp. Cy-647]NIF99378.1 hypothetical protein [Burkholderia sp. Ax-1720]